MNKKEIKKSRHSRVLLSGIFNACRSILSCEKQQNVEDPRLQTSGMTPYFMKSRAFTLIELLVVVLIIGILAAIALPQYQKAVRKAHLAQWAIYINAIDKAMDVWILANGNPTENTRFSGDGTNSDGYKQSTLDVYLPCLKEEGNHCYTKFARFHIACATNNCFIDMGTSYDGYAGPFPKGTIVETAKFPDGRYNGERVLSKVVGEDKAKQVICEWWKNNFGLARMTDGALGNCGYSS